MKDIHLPITCNQLYVIIIGVITAIGMGLYLLPAPFSFIGAIILGVELLLGAVLGLVLLLFVLSEHVKCKCDK